MRFTEDAIVDNDMTYYAIYNLINDGNLKELIDIYKNQNIKLSE